MKADKRTNAGVATIKEARSDDAGLILQFDNRGLGDLENCIAAIAGCNPAFITRRIKIGYFDTADFALHRAGVMLSVRRRGKRLIQTLSGPPPGEPERTIKSFREVREFIPDLMGLEPDLAPEWQVSLKRLAIEPAFVIKVRRRECRLKIGVSAVHVVIDQGTIASGAHVRQMSEVKLTLASGQPRTVFEAAACIFKSHRFTLSTMSQATRGFALAIGQPPEFSKFIPLSLDRQGCGDAAIIQILRGFQNHVLTNHDAAADGRNSEGVHQLRIGLRRLRSALRLLRGIMPPEILGGFLENARSAANDCSAARNWDVFLTETLPKIVDGCKNLGDFGSLQLAAEKQRGEAYNSVRHLLSAEPYVRFHLALGMWIGSAEWQACAMASPGLSGPVISFATTVLIDSHRRVHKRGEHFRRLSPQALHRLRVAAKNLRYIADSLGSVMEDLTRKQKRTRRYFRDLSRLQTQLGYANDMVTTCQLIEALSNDCWSTPAVSQAAGVVVGWSAHSVSESNMLLRMAWQTFRRREPPWSNSSAQR